MYKCLNTGSILTNEEYFAVIEREFSTMKQDGYFDDYYDKA